MSSESSHPLARSPKDPTETLRWLLQQDPHQAAYKMGGLSNEHLQGLAARVLSMQKTQRQERQLAFYTAVSKKAEQIHHTDARVMGIGGGNRASKTDTCLAEIAMCATGVFPSGLHSPERIREKFKGPISVRVVVESLTTTLHPTILPKLQWWHWNGVSEPGGEKGHWGWIPRSHLLGANWQRSWSEKLRTLTVICRDPDTNEALGNSKFQFMSVDQDASDFASGEFDIILHDEPPTLAQWREDEARVMSVGGRMMLAMTWPDDPAIAVDWIFDKVYDKAQRGEESYFWTELWTEDNPNLDQDSVEFQRKQWNHRERQVKLYGKPIRFSSRIHPLFTDEPQSWCFGSCRDTCYVEAGRCEKCGSEQVTEFCHVREFEPTSSFPMVWLIDPHPRKPHMYQWWQIDANDDLWLVADGECEEGVEETRDEVARVENDLGLSVTRRIIDPNMGRSPASARNRDTTWQDEFDAVGLQTDLADDSGTGRDRVNTYLKPDPDTWRPRIQVHPRCSKTIFQMKRYVWDDYKERIERDQKQLPKTKNDDYPTLMKYLLNSNPEFTSLSSSGIVRRRQMSRVGPREGRVWVRP